MIFFSPQKTPRHKKHRHHLQHARNTTHKTQHTILPASQTSHVLVYNITAQPQRSTTTRPSTHQHTQHLRAHRQTRPPQATTPNTTTSSTSTTTTCKQHELRRTICESSHVVPGIFIGVSCFLPFGVFLFLVRGIFLVTSC